MDDLAPKMLKVGKATVGLIGLDVALNRVRGDSSLNDREAAERVFADIAGKNYIPPTAMNDYKLAIRKAVSRLRGGEDGQDDDIVIRILGPGCVSCNNLQKLVIEIMNELNIAADVFQVHDLDEIGRFGVLQTPALVINGELKCAGRLPTRAKVEEWLRDNIL